jgi:hypothetical protein
MARKLIVRLKGGLGNQLFGYAVARRLAWANDAELVLDAVTGFKYDYRYKRKYALNSFRIQARMANRGEQMEPLGRLRRLMARKTSALRPLNQRRYIEQVGVNFDPGILDLRLQEGSTYFDPFGQSEQYFRDIREFIQQDLEMLAPAEQLPQDLAACINGRNAALCDHKNQYISWREILALIQSRKHYGKQNPKTIDNV